jgi:hypothetical protein
VTLTKHHRRGWSDVIAAKAEHGNHRACYDPGTQTITFSAHGSGHDVVVSPEPLTKAQVEQALREYPFRCC